MKLLYPKTVALVSKNDVNQEMKFLIGRYDNPNLGARNASSNVEISITHFPYCMNCTLPLVIQRIPSNDVNHAVPLNEPITTYTGSVSFTGDSASVFLNGFVDGDAYIIYVNPSDESLLTATASFESELMHFELYPNPASSLLNVTMHSDQETQLQVCNAMGVVVKEMTVQHSAQIDIADLADGIYIVSVKNRPNQAQKFVKQ